MQGSSWCAAGLLALGCRPATPAQPATPTSQAPVAAAPSAEAAPASAPNPPEPLPIERLIAATALQNPGFILALVEQVDLVREKQCANASDTPADLAERAVRYGSRCGRALASKLGDAEEEAGASKRVRDLHRGFGSDARTIESLRLALEPADREWMRVGEAMAALAFAKAGTKDVVADFVRVGASHGAKAGFWVGFGCRGFPALAVIRPDQQRVALAKYGCFPACSDAMKGLAALSQAQRPLAARKACSPKSMGARDADEWSLLAYRSGTYVAREGLANLDRIFAELAADPSWLGERLAKLAHEERERIPCLQVPGEYPWVVDEGARALFHPPTLGDKSGSGAAWLPAQHYAVLERSGKLFLGRSPVVFLGEDGQGRITGTPPAKLLRYRGGTPEAFEKTAQVLAGDAAPPRPKRCPLDPEDVSAHRDAAQRVALLAHMSVPAREVFKAASRLQSSGQSVVFVTDGAAQHTVRWQPPDTSPAPDVTFQAFIDGILRDR